MSYLKMLKLFIFMLIMAVSAVNSTLLKPSVKGFPGIKKRDKNVHTSTMRMFRMRNIMATWYCDPGKSDQNKDKLVCINMYDFDNNILSKVDLKESFTHMYSEFCRYARDNKYHDTICADALLAKTYQV